MSSESLSAAISTLLARQEIADLAQHWGRARDQGRWEDHGPWGARGSIVLFKLLCWPVIYGAVYMTCNAVHSTIL